MGARGRGGGCDSVSGPRWGRRPRRVENRGGGRGWLGLRWCGVGLRRRGGGARGWTFLCAGGSWGWVVMRDGGDSVLLLVRV